MRSERVRGRRRATRIVMAACAAMLLGSAVPAPAESAVWLTPTLGEAVLWDDNIFVVPDDRRADREEDDPATLPRLREKEGDFVSRTTAGMELAWRSKALELVGEYVADAEVYADHPGLNQLPTRQLGRLSADGRSGPRTTWGLSLNGARTETPGDLNAADPLIPSEPTGEPPPVTAGTDLERRRSRTDLASASGHGRYELTELTSIGALGSFTITDATFGSDTRTTAAELSAERRLTRRTDASLAYRFRDFRFDDDDPFDPEPASPEDADDGGSGDERSHAMVGGFSTELTRRLTLGARGGPRFSDRGSPSPEVEATVEYQLPPRAHFRFRYHRSQGTAVGEDEVVNVEGFSGQLRYEIDRWTELSLLGGLTRNDQESGDRDVYRAGIGVVRRLREWLLVEIAYDFTFQDEAGPGSAEDAFREEDDLTRNLARLSLVVFYPWRLR